ncbi:MAG: ABC transporter permease [Candidatus Krumholzibacteriota bacterium]|nr:ABC transporter permease [Candidatus Krumholzibacteriota bacterium]
MRKTLKLAKREYLAAVRSKGFIIALVLAPILMSGSILAMALLGDKVDTTDQRLAVVDRSGVVAEALVAAAEERNAQAVHDEAGKKVRPAYLIEVVPPAADAAAQRLALSDRVRAGELRAFLEIGPEVLHPGEDAEARAIRYHARNATMDDLRGWLGWPVNTTLRKARLAEAGMDAAALDAMLIYMGVEAMGLVERDAAGGAAAARRSSEGEALGVPFAMVMLMFLMLMMGAIPQLNAVMEEKNQRIAEVLLGSVSPFQFMMGKVLGGLAVSLTGAIVYVALGVVALSYTAVAFPVPYHILPWFFAWTLLAVVMTGSAMAAVGSACNDPKEAQSLAMPAMMPVLIPMFLLVPVIKSPTSGLATGLSFFPSFTPMLMLLRQSTPEGVPAWQPWAGLAIVLAATVLTIRAGGRIFRVAILMKGQPPTIKNLLRWALRG